MRTQNLGKSVVAAHKMTLEGGEGNRFTRQEPVKVNEGVVTNGWKFPEVCRIE